MSDDNVHWIADIVAHTKSAAGLPPRWGEEATPLTPEEEMEDAPWPARLRSGMTTAELLPYGAGALVTDDEETHELVRLVAKPVDAPGGRITVCDPVSMAWQGPPTQLELKGDLLPVEVAVIRYATARGELVRPCVAVVGDVSAVESWVEPPVPSTRLSIDVGCGAFIAADDVALVAAKADELTTELDRQGVFTVEVEDRVSGVLFASGDGPGDYEMLVGRGRGARPVALLVDLRVLSR
ncbi:hypothetical protein [Intrasporangium chromatireducens]|uniref:hypothetical protein n=1 Tax=Intrasporangium chromatireducens TaxID=1386088 RepID=UPI0012DF880B|nr:hypothetical protein [Intrasporangium chromatireducens]